MIEADKYIKLVKTYFNFLVSEFKFKTTEEKIRGNAFYEVLYKEKAFIISISYENIEDYFAVVIFILKNGVLPDYDDKTKTLHLNQLNHLILPFMDGDEIKKNNQFFASFDAADSIERKILKSAKELRLWMRHSTELIKEG